MKKSLLILILPAILISCQNKQQKNTTRDTASEVSVYELQARNGDDPFLTEKFLALNNSPMQERLRALKPFPVGVVYYQQREHGLEEIRNEFKTMKALGYTALKQSVLDSPKNHDRFEEAVFHAALEEGISPWYYGRGGWYPITQDLLDSLGISLEKNGSNIAEIQNHPRMIEYQTRMMHQRVDRMHRKPPKPPGMGEPGRNSPFLTDRLIPEFARWLRNEYKTIENLRDAWNIGFTRPAQLRSFEDAANLMRTTHVDEFGNRWGQLSWDFRRMRDAMRFQADLIIENYQQTMDLLYEWDPYEPERTGGHQIFENQAINSWDLEAQAQSASIGGSFYASIHLTHHFFLLDGEVTLPVYMQSRIVADMFKGGWSATWESTGGPTQWSGHHHLTVDEYTMKQLFLAYIAAGLKGIGIWTWNSRGEGWEAGEYALTDIQGQPTPRAKTGGELSRILQNQRFELWDAHDEPVVGILYSWENEAMLGRLSMGVYQLPTPVFDTNRDRMFRQYHSEGRIGMSRALMNHNIPFEYLTDRDVLAGLADRYPVIYLPYVLALDQATLTGLKAYVANGGKLVADFPVLMLDNYGRLNKHLPGSDFEQLFGFSTADYYHTFNSPKSFRGIDLDSQFGELKITSGEVKDTFDDGTPAIISNHFGKGQTLVFNFEASRDAFRAGNQPMEEILATETLGNIRPPFLTSITHNTYVFRRAAPRADHYFIINYGDTEQVTFWSEDITYKGGEELISGEKISLVNNRITLEVPSRSGKWIRLEK